MVRSIVLAGLIALSVSGCDRAAGDAAQESAALTPKNAAAPGEIVRDFAGTELPALTFVDASGDTLDLGGLDQPVLLNLWATWCGPCVVEMPQLDALAGAMQGRLRVVTVSQDIRGADVVTPFFAERDFAHLEPWLDPETQLGEALEEGALLPLTLLYDDNGREVLRVQGGYEWDSEEAIALIEEALATSAG